MSATSKSNCEIIPFCNYALIESGTPVSAVKSTITRCFNNWARENGIIKKKEKNLDGSSIQEGLVIAFNLVSQILGMIVKLKLEQLQQKIIHLSLLFLENN